MASSNTLIKIDEGLYKENIVITKPNIFLAPSNEPDIFLVGEEGPTILVDIDPSLIGTVHIQGFKISNKGILNSPVSEESEEFNYNPKKYKELTKYVIDS